MRSFLSTYLDIPDDAAPEVGRTEPRRVAPAPAPAPRAQGASDPFVARMADALTRSVGGRRDDVQEAAHIERQDPSTGMWRRAATTKNDPQYIIRRMEEIQRSGPRGTRVRAVDHRGRLIDLLPAER
jgi:hypothetical protein